jgi:hypothetical protein
VQEVPLSSRKYPGLVALVDDEDYERIIQCKWWPYVSPKSKTIYAHGYEYYGAPYIYLHRFVMRIYDARVEIDHRDGNGLNCQKSNLRRATRSQQTRNVVKSQGSVQSPLYKGVKRVMPNFERRTNPWRASIYVNGKIVHLGVFPNPEAAARAYDSAAREHYGEFAKTNFEEGDQNP